MVGSRRGALIYEREADFALRLQDAGTQLRSRGRVVLCSGCFDLLHAGHLVFLKAAAAAGDALVVAMNSDASVRELKGAKRPIVSEEGRSNALLELPMVDFVVVCEGRDARSVLDVLRPSVFVIGPDSEAGYPEETAMARELGADVFVVEREGAISTTRLVQAFRATGGHDRPERRSPLTGWADGPS